MDNSKCIYGRKFKNEPNGMIELYFKYFAPEILVLFKRLKNVDAEYFTIKVEYPVKAIYEGTETTNAKVYISPIAEGYKHEWIPIKLSSREIADLIRLSKMPNYSLFVDNYPIKWGNHL